MAPISTVSEGCPELPIRQRGLFLNDNFFRDSREHFQQALDKVLHDWDDQKLSDWHSSKLTHWDEDIFSDRLKRYRILRKENIKTDVQAVTEIDDEHQYKIIIDVREFMQGCLKTSIVGDRELLVEGSIEEIISGVKGKRSFEKRFLLPSEAILSDTTSALSSDGILTIISPKKVVGKEMKQNQSTSLNQKHSMFADDFIDDSLPISRKGHFFSDSSFKHAHEDFNRAVRDVLGRWNETTENDIASYRNLRRQSLEQENQAFTEKENHCIYKIVIDVQDFLNDGEVNVKVINDKYLEVEGCIDKEEDNTKCKKTFKRRFTLPKNTDIKNISSLLSSDGVLTITAPKVPGFLDFRETIIPMKLEKFLKKESSESALETESNNSSIKKPNKTHPVAVNECSSEIESTTESENCKEMKKNINNEFIIPVTLEEDYNKQKTTITVSRSSQERDDKILSKASASDKEISSEKGIINTNEKHILNVINEEGANSTGAESDLSEAASEVSHISSHLPIQSKVDGHLDNATSQQEHNSAISSSQMVSGNEYIIPVNMEIGDEVSKNDSNKNLELKTEEKRYKQEHGTESSEVDINIEHEQTNFSEVPIVKRGPFFVDSFFTESQKQFEKAVQNILQQSGFNSKENDLDFYRSLRQRSNSEQNQANGCTEDDTSFKIVVDIQDFKNDVKIKIHNANELTVEGEQNQNQNLSLLKRHFCRKFIFPCHINSDAVTSAVSEEGILTINVPKNIKESCEEAKSNKSVKSILISNDSNDGLNKSNKKDCLSKQNKEVLCISEDHNEKTITSADGPLHNVVEGQTLPITGRGSFFTDPFFEDNRLILRKSIKDIIDKSGFISKDDDFSFYRSMLERSTNKENKAATITESDNFYKVVLDIQGFSAEEIKTKFLSSTKLVIEATTEKKKNGSSSTRHFQRCFVFPNSVNVEDVITSLSSDGILTISAPMKIKEGDKEEGSCSTDFQKHIHLNNGWEDEKTAQTSSEKDGVRTKTFSKSKSSCHNINGVN